MTRTVLFLEHDPLDPPGRLAEALAGAGFFSRVVRLHRGDPLPEVDEPLAAVVSLGGHANVDEGDSHPWIDPEIDFLRRIHDRRVPILGVCLGHQLLACALGGSVGPMRGNPEIGLVEVRRHAAADADPVLGGAPSRLLPMQCHGYEVQTLPDGARALATSRGCAIQAFRSENSLGIQFHVEWSRDAIAAVLERNREWALESGLDPAAVEARVELEFPRYERDSRSFLRAFAKWLEVAPDARRSRENPEIPRPPGVGAGLHPPKRRPGPAKRTI